jgi:hypothetical protein
MTWGFIRRSHLLCWVPLALATCSSRPVVVTPVRAPASSEEECKADLLRILKADEELKADVDRGLVRYRKFDDETTRAVGTSSSGKARHIYRVLDSSKWNKIIRYKVTQPIRDMLMRMNGHVLPVAAFDEAPIAFAWARAAYGRANEHALALIPDFDASTGASSVTTDLMNLVAKTKAYQKEMDAIVADVADITMEIQAIERLMKEDKAWAPEGYVIDIPMFSTPDTGLPGIYRETYMSRVDAAHRLGNLRGQLAAAQARMYFDGESGVLWKPWTYVKSNTSTLRMRAYDQGVALLKLRTYYNLLKAEQRKARGKALPTEYESFLKSIEDMLDTSGAQWKVEFRPPDWVQRKIRYIQLTDEAWSLFFKKIPKMAENRTVKMVKNFVDSLTDEEKRNLGLNRLSLTTGLERIKSTRFVSIFIAGSTLIGGGAAIDADEYTIEPVKNFVFAVFADYMKRNSCIYADTEDDFIKCTAEYLRYKFSNKSYKGKLNIREILMENGKLADPDVALALADLMDKRLNVVRERQSDQALSEVITSLLSNKSMLTETFRTRLIEADDEEWFRDKLTNPDPVKGYLSSRFPLAFEQKEVQNLIKLVLDNEDEEVRNAAYTRIRFLSDKTVAGNKRERPGGAELAGELRDLMEKHAEYKNSQSVSQEALETVEQAAAGALQDLAPAKE